MFIKYYHHQKYIYINFCKKVEKYFSKIMLTELNDNILKWFKQFKNIENKIYLR